MRTIAPIKISPAQIAVSPLTLITAYQSLRDAGYYEANCGQDKSILIHAGAGGVGHMAIQLCANIYNFDRIVTTCSHENIEFVKSLGATDVVNFIPCAIPQEVTTPPYFVEAQALLRVKLPTVSTTPTHFSFSRAVSMQFSS